MNRKLLISLFVVLGLIASACGGEATPEPTAAPAATTVAPTTVPATTPPATEPPEPITLLIWADEARAPVVQSIAAAFTEATGVEISVEILEFGQIRDQMGIAGPAGEGPDIFVGAHDWLGQLVADGAAAPVDLGDMAGDFFDVAITAFSYEGDLYAVPYATEAVAMYYNTDLVPDAPATFEEIAAICDGLTGIDNCVGIPGGGDAADAYHNYPFVSALGGYIFAYDAATGFDATDVGLDSDEAIAGVQFLADQIKAGVIGSVNYDGAKNLFLEGKQPFWITGPWEVGNLNSQEAINWAVAKIPTIGGNAPAPFVGAQGFFLSNFSENTVVAQSFLLDFIATQETQQALYDADPRTPAFKPVFDALGDNPVAATFALSAADGVPMPNIPQMGSVWSPLGDNLLLVRNGEISAEDAMTTAANAVREAVSN